MWRLSQKGINYCALNRELDISIDTVLDLYKNEESLDLLVYLYETMNKSGIENPNELLDKMIKLMLHSLKMM
jgi:hypothetical protein